MQPEQDDPDDASEPPFSLAPAMPKVDIFFSGLAHLHFGHSTCVLLKTSFSKSSPQRGQWYSYIGILNLFHFLLEKRKWSKENRLFW